VLSTDNPFYRQVVLLVELLPLIARESCFALKGGTAINLFIRDLPRLSVDIDLTYIPIQDRGRSLAHIDESLRRLGTAIETTLRGAKSLYVGRSGELTTKFQVCRDQRAFRYPFSMPTIGETADGASMDHEHASVCRSNARTAGTSGVVRYRVQRIERVAARLSCVFEKAPKLSFAAVRVAKPAHVPIVGLAKFLGLEQEWQRRISADEPKLHLEIGTRDGALFVVRVGRDSDVVETLIEFPPLPHQIISDRFFISVGNVA
jgi:Nucleotidyl transferase AbiEii toxin, Type IV TA system